MDNPGSTGRWARLWRHLLVTDAALRRTFSAGALDRIEAAVKAGERTHGAQLRCVIEADLDLGLVWQGVTARQRALDLFAQLHVWDTALDNGVLLYVQLADRAVEIVADRGLHGRVAPDEWAAICTHLQAAFAAGEAAAGMEAAVGEIAAVLARHFPAAGGGNELPDRPLIL